MSGPSDSVGGIGPEISPEDDHYIRSHFVTLSEIARLCRLSEAELKARQSSGSFPRPTYTTADGSEWYPRGYAVPVRRADRAGISLRELFFNDFYRLSGRSGQRAPGSEGDRTAAASTLDRQILAEWEGYLTGEYGACLKVPWVPCILQKGGLMARIDALLLQPKPEDWAWTNELRQAVDALDHLEQPFAALDRIRFGGPVSRDRYILATRGRYPLVFGREPRASSSQERRPEGLTSDPDKGLVC